MTVGEALNLGTKKLKSTLDSEVLLSHVLGKSKEFLMAQPDEPLTSRQEKKFITLISRRQLGWPVAYLTSQKEFFELKFFVDKNVLVPRPETETLIEAIVEYFQKVRPHKKRALKILDLGTGSGNIIVSLAKTSLNSQVFKDEFFASDISAKALKVARKNARRHKVKITFKKGGLLEPWKNQVFDIIVANLPYLTKLEHPSTKFEPRKALLAAKKGLALYEKLFKQVRTLYVIPDSDRGSKLDSRFRGNGLMLFLEFDPRQTKQIKNLANKYLPGFDLKIYKDLTGKNRVIRLSFL